MELPQNNYKIKEYPHSRMHYQGPEDRPGFDHDVGHEEAEGDGPEAFEDRMAEVEKGRRDDL